MPLPVPSRYILAVTDGAIERGLPDRHVFRDDMGNHAPFITYHRAGPTLIHWSSVAPGLGQRLLGHDSSEIEQKHAIV